MSNMRVSQLLDYQSLITTKFNLREKRELSVFDPVENICLVFEIQLLYHSDMNIKPDSIMAVLQNYCNQIDTDIATNKNTTCKKGCADCCIGDFDISITEFFFILNYLNIRYGKRFVQKYADSASVSLPTCPCIFVNSSDHSCDIYSVRPLVCRKYGLYKAKTHCYKMNHKTELLDKECNTLDNTILFDNPVLPEKPIFIKPKPIIYWFSKVVDGELSSKKLKLLYEAAFNLPAEDFIKLFLI